jgi:predicted NAD/FAD-binding protein/dienelactone hydrolase
MIPIARMLHREGADHGVAVWTVRYRFRGWNGTEASPVADVRRALGEVRRRHGSVPVVLVGHSLGGRTALRVADDESVRAVIALAPWLPASEPVTPIRQRRVLIVHGDADRVTDPRGSLDYQRRAVADGTEASLIKIPGAGHAMLHEPSRWHGLVTGFVTEEVSRALASEPDTSLARISAQAASSARIGEPPPRRRIAVIGGGVSGLTAAWVLRDRDDLTVYEAEDRLGGHAHTHDVLSPEGTPLAVDSGFLVHNERTYPTLLALFRELGVSTQDSEMSMSVRCDGCGLEYAGAKGLAGLLAKPRTLADPRYLRMVAEVPRFHRAARRLLESAGNNGGPSSGGNPSSPSGSGHPSGGGAVDHGSYSVDRTLGEFLRQEKFSAYFIAHVVVPLVAAVWSCSPRLAMRYPARYLFEFLANHGMLSVTGSPQWRTVSGGSRTYVERLARQLPAVRTSTPIREFRRLADGVQLRDESDQVTRYDAAIIATHPGQALRMLSDASELETRVLGAFGYSRNETLLHTDSTVLPRRRTARASWNYRLDSCAASPDRVAVSYDVTRLQRLNTTASYLVTLNDDGRIDQSRVLARMVYEHPVYTPGSVAAQALLPSLNSPVIAYAGAYHGWGFHEDGCLSGLRAAEALSIPAPLGDSRPAGPR